MKKKTVNMMKGCGQHGRRYGCHHEQQFRQDPKDYEKGG